MDNTITNVKNDHLLIQNGNGEVIFKIDNEGNIFFKLNGIFKKFEDEKELALIFVSCISGLTNIPFQNKEDIYNKIISNRREGKINLLLD